jgi:hypothetical protein
VKHHKPIRRIFELEVIWQSLTTNDRNSWLRLARAMKNKQAPSWPVHLIHVSMALAAMLMLFFPFSLRSTILSIGGGYVLAVNLAIVRVYIEGIRSR